MTSVILCPDPELTDLLATLEAGPGNDNLLGRVEDLLDRYSTDPRLHFLRGSLLASAQDHAAAIAAMQQALDLDPEYGLARFQLGLFHLTVNHPAEAQSTWAPLQMLPTQDPLYCFVAGLRHLIDDQFDEAVRLLERGMAFNTINPALNVEMTNMIAAIRARESDDRREESSSATHMLLQQSALRTTRH